MSSIVHQIKHFISILFNLVLDVHLTATSVVLFTRQSIIHPKVVWVGGEDFIELIVVELGVRVGNTHEEPSQAGEFVIGDVFVKHASPEGSEWGDTGTGGDHEDDGVGVLWEEEDFACWAGHGDFLSWGGITEEVGAKALLGWVVSLELWAPVGGTADTEGGSLAVKVVAVARRGNGIEASSMWDFLALGVDLGSWRDDAVRLALDERDLAVSLDDNVHGLTGGLRADNAFYTDDFACEGVLWAVGVHGEANFLKFQRHILLGDFSGSSLGLGTDGEATSTSTSSCFWYNSLQ